MKRLGFAIAVAALAGAVSPALAQSGVSASYEFVKAVEQSNGAKATQLLESNPPGIVNGRDNAGNTPLIVAIARQDVDWTGFLIDKGADVNLAGKNGDTPLIAAARASFPQPLGWLLQAGAKVDATNRMGETPLIVAVQQRDLKMVRALLLAGADPDKTDSAAGLSARDYATRDTRSRQILSAIEARKPKPASAAK